MTFCLNPVGICFKLCHDHVWSRKRSPASCAIELKNNYNLKWTFFFFIFDTTPILSSVTPVQTPSIVWPALLGMQAPYGLELGHGCGDLYSWHLC